MIEDELSRKTAVFQLQGDTEVTKTLSLSLSHTHTKASKQIHIRIQTFPDNMPSVH